MGQHQVYRAKRSTQRWLEGAPDYVLACFDGGKGFADRYTVIIGGRFQEGGPHYRDAWLHVAHIGPASYGSHPGGWASMTANEAATFRYNFRHKKMKWSDLPECIRGTIVAFGKEETEQAA